MTDAKVLLWDSLVGVVSWDEERDLGVFQYHPSFGATGVEISPFMMPARPEPYEFPTLRGEAFRGLPGLLADALPDRFGNRLIDIWLTETGRALQDFDPVSRLCYVGQRGVGALEFRPALSDEGKANPLDVAQLADFANRVLDERYQLGGTLGETDGAKQLEDILKVGTSAGGARAKAVLAWNPATGEFRSGQVEAGGDFEHWLLKFDGVSNDRSGGLSGSQGFGRIEYAYHLMAREAGVEMMDCRLHHEGGRSHFMTRRFDRDGKGRKIHVQTLAALRHYDLNDPRSYAYEQAVQTIRSLGLGMPAVEEQFRRTIFNVVARNQDDHVKNISFLMDQTGAWRLSPAYDIIYSYNPSGLWTREHQMSMAGKRDGFEREDAFRFAESSGIKKRVATRILDEVLASVKNWPAFGLEAGLDEEIVERIGRTHRTYLVKSLVLK